MSSRRLMEDPVLQELVFAAFRNGASISIAAYNAGVSREAVKSALERGDKDIENDLETFDSNFALRARQAQAAAAMGYLSDIDTAAHRGEWRAAAWKLAKLYPNDYGSKGEVTHKMEFNWKDAVAKANEELADNEGGTEDVEDTDE